jgi:hypothetical protein
MLDKIKRLTTAIALLASLLVSLPIAQGQANANAKHKICKTQAASRTYTRVPYASPTYNRRLAQTTMAAKYDWCGVQNSCLQTLWNNESGWRVNAHNPSGAHGIPQALPGHKMGTGWQSNPAVQINWGLKYIKNRYGTPCKALAFWNRNHWY